MLKETTGGRESRGNTQEAGFALVLAILSLLLLTFLGLTLAVTSSTELQIATNYKWSQQAYYNAEAGLEAGRLALAQIANSRGDWSGVVPAGRPGVLAYPNPAPPGGWTGVGRDFFERGCDTRGGVGYGVVLQNPTGTRWENLSSWVGDNKTLNGAFTVWVRRELTPTANGFIEDTAPGPSSLILTAEGVAPYTGGATSFTIANQSVRILEMTYSLAGGRPCDRGYAQEGGSQFGENSNICGPVSEGPSGSLAASLGAGATGREGAAGGLTRK